jgi:hypothetical protein
MKQCTKLVCNRIFTFAVLQETADEGQGGAEGDSRQSPKNIGGSVTYPPSSASVTVSQPQTSTHRGEVRTLKHFKLQWCVVDVDL